VIAKSFARIHAANLINAGILPVTLENPEDYDALTQGDVLCLNHIHAGLEKGRIEATIEGTGKTVPFSCALTQRQIGILKAGGLLNYTREAGV